MTGVLNLPNTLTFFRVLTTPFFMFFVFRGEYAGAFILFAAGALSDFFDGYFARRFNQITAIGRVLDPAADKIFFVGALGSFAYLGFIPAWFLALIITRDIIVVLGSALYIRRKGLASIDPFISGKLTNVFLFAIIADVLITKTFNVAVLGNVLPYLIYCAIVCSVYSFFLYLRRFVRGGITVRNEPSGE